VNKRDVTPQMQAWIDQSQGMVRAIATKISSRLPAHVMYDDLVSYGQLGLMQAVYSFEPNRDVTFQTFAYHRIRGAIYDGLGKMSWTSRAISQRIRAERLSAELLEQQIHASRAQEAANSLSADADWLVRTTERIAVVHLLTDSADCNQGLADTVADEHLAPDEAVAHQELCELLRATVSELPETERTLIQLTYFEGKSLTEAAEKLCKSKSWASRVHARILEKLTRSLASHGID
jgi:RNA polymerase sigma factor FliA